MPDSYDRENQLQEQLNIFLENKFGLPDADYYAQLDQHIYAQSVFSICRMVNESS